MLNVNATVLCMKVMNASSCRPKSVFLTREAGMFAVVVVERRWSRSRLLNAGFLVAAQFPFEAEAFEFLDTLGRHV